MKRCTCTHEDHGGRCARMTPSHQANRMCVICKLLHR